MIPYDLANDSEHKGMRIGPVMGWYDSLKTANWYTNDRSDEQTIHGHIYHSWQQTHQSISVEAEVHVEAEHKDPWQAENIQSMLNQVKDLTKPINPFGEHKR